MKKQLEFKYIKEKGIMSYKLFSDEKEIVSIPYDTLTLSSKDLYENLFSEIVEPGEIEIVVNNLITHDVDNPDAAKRGNIVFGIVNKLINDVVRDINKISTK